MNVHNPAKDIYVGVMKTCKRVFGSSIKLSFKLSILKWGVNEFHHDYQKLFIFACSYIFVLTVQLVKVNEKLQMKLLVNFWDISINKYKRNVIFLNNLKKFDILRHINFWNILWTKSVGRWAAVNELRLFRLF